MFEIGVDQDKSIKLWEEYFPKATIYGMDIDLQYKFPRGEVFKGDQSNLDDCAKVVQKIGQKIEFILDDGSHEPDHQILTFIYLFENLLKEGGTYIIEDIETSYWTRGKLYGNIIKYKKSVIEVFKFLVDRLNSEFIRDKSVFNKSVIPESIQSQIELISFQYNSIIIKKRYSENAFFNHRKYRFENTLYPYIVQFFKYRCFNILKKMLKR